MKRIALVTCQEIPGLILGDQPIAAELRALGHEATPAIWDDPAIDWARFDALVIQSPWDYYLKAQAYYSWLDHIKALEVPCLNGTNTLRWNAHKGYLLDLESQGCAVVPTALYEKGHSEPLDVILQGLRQGRGWGPVVFKPAINGAGINTLKIQGDPSLGDVALFAELIAEADMLLQPFLPEIGTQGEISLIFFGGAYSHGVLKTAKAGEFRIQSEHGGRTQPYEASPELIELGQEIMAAAEGIVGERAFYGRVDLIEAGGEPLLMELELIEPERFFDYKVGSAQAYARAILNHPSLT